MRHRLELVDLPDGGARFSFSASLAARPHVGLTCAVRET